MSQVSGMAASVRNATESETFDLAGQSPATIEKMIHDAFSEPMALEEMIRLTFITGAGKLGRQKYDDGAAKAVTSALREIGFEDDRGASAVMECAGSFKLQHDTGKNFKTVVVFPKVAVKTNGNSIAGGVIDGTAGVSLSDGVIPENTPEHKLAYSSMTIFEANIGPKCQTWSQKKGCLAALESLIDIIQKLQEKLISGTPLSEEEQECFDTVSINSLEEKQKHVRDLMHQQVADGRLTSDEKAMLLNQVTDRIATLSKDIAQAEQDAKKKRVDNLTVAKQKAEDRKALLEGIVPKPLPPLKNEAEIGRLRREMVPLEEIEAKAKGRLLTVKESQVVARKEELAEEILDLEEQSRGWFESDEVFLDRVERSRKTFSAQKKTAGKKKKTGTTASSTSTASKWSVPTSRMTAAPVQRKSKPHGSGGGLFAAMMADSDSD